jgi:hypothetical protein
MKEISLKPNEEAIIQIVEQVSKTNIDKIRSPYRGSEVTLPRSILSIMLREGGVTAKRVGEIINRHHASILKYSKDHKFNILSYPEYKDMYLKVQEEHETGYRGAEVTLMQQQINELQSSIRLIKRRMIKAGQIKLNNN